MSLEIDKIADLAERMRDKRESGSHPYVLILGAGASLASGTSLNKDVIKHIVGPDGDLKDLDAHLSKCSDIERFGSLRTLIEGSTPSEGYRCLAELIRAGYFDVILSTNFDPLLEDAMVALSDPMKRRQYILLVHGVMELERIGFMLDELVPKVKILKLHGDLFYHKFFYTGEEIKEFPSEISSHLNNYFTNRDILIVGHSMGDTDINSCLKKKGEGSIWYVNPSPPSDEIARVLESRKSKQNVVSGQNGKFDPFFIQLWEKLLGGTAKVNIHDIEQSIYSIGRADGTTVGSGFLLGNTGLLVTDSTILRGILGGHAISPGIKAKVRPFEGGVINNAELVVTPETVLDYAVFRIKGTPEISPLKLADGLPSIGEAVTACISVGESQGFHDGTITGININKDINMGGGHIQTIPNLIETDIKISPGACGSPLVRKDGSVVGVIVAGPIHSPGPSYALNSLRLGDILLRQLKEIQRDDIYHM